MEIVTCRVCGFEGQFISVGGRGTLTSDMAAQTQVCVYLKEQAAAGKQVTAECPHFLDAIQQPTRAR